MDIVKIIKTAQNSAGHVPTGIRGDIDLKELPYLLEEVWKYCGAKGMRVVDWKEFVSKVIGFRRFILYESEIDEFAYDKVHDGQCFISNFEMYIA